MNNSTTTGKFDQVKGKVKQSVGEAIGNDKLANSGAADQVKGAAKEAWGHTKDAANVVGADSRARVEEHRAGAKVRAEDAAHKVRENVTHAAQHVKNAVRGQADKVKHDHGRP
jgi:uncharacterized protein YjbJ (UPF0337 family)